MDNRQNVASPFDSEKKMYLNRKDSYPKGNYDLKLSANVISRLLFRFTAILVLAHVSAFVIGYMTKSQSVWLIYFQYYFNMENENNVPTYFSSILLLFAAVILLLIRSVSANNKNYWLSLSGIFLFLALDEALEIHEKANLFARKYITGNLFNLPWILPYAIVFGVAGLFYLKFLKALPGKTQKDFFIAGTIYVAAAGGIEAIDGILFNYFPYEHVVFRLTSFFQETLEMVGIILFIRYLVEYIQSQFQTITITAK
jgi:hypothetical protein